MSRILAIDEINDNLISLKAIINDAFPGSIVYTALNGPKGIDLAITHNPDVILLNIIRPGMDGFEVCRLLKLDVRVRDIPVVFLTDLNGDKGNRIKALEAGAEGFLSKPIDQTELTAQIRAMVKIKAANEQKRDEKERLKRLVEERTRDLVQSQAQLNGIFQNLQDAYFQTDLSGCITIASPSAVKMYGYQSPDELIGQRAGNLYFDINERAVLLSLLGSAGRTEDYVCQGRKSDGSSFWISMNVQLLRNNDGQVTGTEGVVRDISERKQAEDVLKESEERFRHISSSISDISYSCVNDLEGNSIINWLYGATEKITGYTIDELFVMKCWGKLVPEEDFPIFKSNILGVLPGKSKTCQLRLKRKDGNVVWIQATAECIKGPEGTDFNILYGGIVDITNRKQAEELLRESEEKYRIMVELMPDAVVIHEGGEFVFANAAALKTVGADSFEQLIERPLMEYVHPDFRNVSLGRIKKIYSTGQPSTFSEEKFITLKGEIINVEVIGIPILHRGKPAIQTIIRDITERKKAEEALKESEARFKLVFEASNVAESITLPTGEINVNQAFCDMFGYTESELKGKKWQDVTFPEEAKIDQKLIDSILRGEKNGARRIKRYIHKSGRTIIGDVSYALIRDDNKRPLHFITTIIDITDRKRAEDELHENVARLELAMNVANMSWWEMDRTTGQVTFERRKAEMLGYPTEKFKHYSDFMDLVHPEDQERTMDAMRSLLDGSLDKYEVEYRIKTISGEYKWFYDVGSVTKRDPEGKPHIVSGLVLDISERKHVDEELQNSHDMLEKLAAQVPGVVYKYRLYPDGRSAFPFSSDGMYDIYEVTPEEVREDASPVFTRLHPDDYDYIVETITESARNQTLYHSEFRVILPKQGVRWRMSDAKPELLKDGSTLWHGIITDITERKQGEEALTESVQLFKGLFNASPDAIVLIDPHHPTISWPIVDCNEASCRMNGYTREEMTGQSIDILNVTKEKPEDRVAYYNELKQKGIIHTETSHRHKDGHIFPIEVLTSIIVIGGREMVLGIDRDITERKQAEMALKESEDRYRSFISQVSEGVYRFECDQPIDISLSLEEQVDLIYDHMFIAECNDAFLKIYGTKDRSEMIGKGHLYFHGGRYHPVNREVLVTFIKNGYRIENALTEEVNHQGQMTYISHNSLGIIENNQLVRMWGTQIDITKKIRADRVQQVLYTISNATLSTSNLTELIEIISNELARLLDLTNFFIAFYDESTNMLSTLYEKGDKDNINHWPAEKSLTGYIIKHQKSLLAHGADIQKLCETGEIEIVGIASKIWMGVPLSVNKKVIGAIVVQSYDNPEAFNEKDKLMLEFVSHQICISIERKRVEQELNTALTKAQESDRLKSAFLANMSHEIRTPLNSIIGFSEFMADPDFDTGQQTEFARIIINSGNSLLTIISDIMDFSKIEAGQVIVNKLQFVVQKLISKLQKEYSLAAQDKGIELRIDPQNPKEEIWIRSDENRLRQVLVNLVGNAIKFTKEGYVEIGLKATGDCIQFHVSDTGIGIPEEFHDEIFERFRQVESSNSRKYGGNGLGLAISKSLVEIMGGEIWIESVQEKGSTFYFTIPIGLTTT